MTLRTELPQASRVVMPTAASRRMIAGVSSMWTKWSWKSCRVVTCAMPSEYSSARSASISSCARVQAAEGNLDALHARGVPQRVRALGAVGG